MKSNLIVGKEKINKLLLSIEPVIDALKISYGPNGASAIIERELYPYHEVANDFETIIQSIHFEDKFEKIILDLFKELSSKSDKDSGDGRKTTALIAYEILKEGVKSDLSLNELRDKLNSFIPLIEKDLDAQKTNITEEQIEAVATIAGESEKIGKMLSEVYKKIGKEGIIHIENSNTYTDSWSFIEGIRFAGAGYLSPYLVYDADSKKTKQKETKAVYENPVILVTKRRINHLDDINPLLATLEKYSKKDLVIFTDDMDSGVASTLIKNHKEGKFNILIIPCPIIWKNYIFEDFAKVTGSTIVEEASGITFKNLKLEHLGTCAKIATDKEETIITGGVDVSEHKADLEARGDTDSLLRLSWLTTKTCILKLGANNDSELSHYRLKMKDAISSSRLALKDGIVQGSGFALGIAALNLPDTEVGNIIKQGLEAPKKQLLINNGKEELEIGPEIVDACAVIKNAVRNAIGLASTILTIGIAISLPNKTSEQIAAEVLQNKGIRL